MSLPADIINSDIHIFRFNWRPGQVYNCNNVVSVPVDGNTFKLFKCLRHHTASDTMDSSIWEFLQQ